MLAFVILLTFVGGGKIMFATELVFAVLTLERQEIDEVAVLSGALVSNGEEASRRFSGGGHGGGQGCG